ncbi:MAG: hypothetical protein ACE5EX_08270 [Phycisphaerae bacterium]
MRRRPSAKPKRSASRKRGGGAPVPVETTPASDVPESLNIVPTIYPTSPPVAEQIDRFWETGPEFDSVQVRIAPADNAMELLERLGPSPFGRGEFPLIGFLATTYDKVSRYATQRG